MPITTDDLAKIQRAIRNGLDFESTGLEKTAALHEAFLEIQSEYANAPEGTMAEVVEDATWGQWDALIAASEKGAGIKFF